MHDVCSSVERKASHCVIDAQTRVCVCIFACGHAYTQCIGTGTRDRPDRKANKDDGALTMFTRETIEDICQEMAISKIEAEKALDNV